MFSRRPFLGQGHWGRKVDLGNKRIHRLLPTVQCHRLRLLEQSYRYFKDLPVLLPLDGLPDVYGLLGNH